MDCDFTAILLDKFSQWGMLTQLVLLLGGFASFCTFVYFIHKTVIGILYHVACCIQLERRK